MAKFGFARDEAWTTDCLDTYFGGVDGAAAIAGRFVPFAQAAGLDAGLLATHPSESDIVRLAKERRERLLADLAAAQPQTIITLGNAALRVVADVVGQFGKPIGKLSPEFGVYGKPLDISIGEASCRWVPLAHPAAPRSFQDAHKMWRPKV